jgi:hypothetical protein
MNEIYANVSTRQNEFRTLLYRQETPLLKRAVNKMRALLG